MKIEEKQVGSLLNVLGNTADEVADSLRLRGIKGYKGDACQCPVANYLIAELGTYPGDLVTYDIVSYSTPDDSGFSFRTPEPVFQFILRFDTGVYPDLRAERGTL